MDAHKISSSGMQTRVSSSPPRARKDTTDFFTLRRALRALARLITPAATTAAALGALTFGVALGALEEVAVCVRVAELLGACTNTAIVLTQKDILIVKITIDVCVFVVVDDVDIDGHGHLSHSDGGL